MKLEVIGYRFKTTGDTEVVLKALVEWGEEALIKFNGMFSLAFYDSKQKRIILARDRYGIKPLYYGIFNEKLIFASEQKAIEAHEAFEFDIDREALLEYFSFQNIFSDRNLSKNIKTLSPGSYLAFDVMSAETTIRSYWDFEFFESSKYRTTREYVDEFQFLFDQ